MLCTDGFEEEKAIFSFFSSAKGMPKKAKSTFDKVWAAKLVESDEALF